ncbi:MAG: hypothetical protein ACXW31_09125 [Thermoanaerobaculia bacterium]
MLHFRTRPDRTGFWFYIEAPAQSRYSFEYVALGPGGHQTSGEYHGRAAEDPEWVLIGTTFPVVLAGVGEISVAEPSTGAELALPLPSRGTGGTSAIGFMHSSASAASGSPLRAAMLGARRLVNGGVEFTPASGRADIDLAELAQPSDASYPYPS